MSDSPTSSAPRLGERFVDALAYAARLHATQTRKGAGTPYVGHLLGAASSVIDAGGDEDEAIAALLHDAVEDQGGLPTLAHIRDRFGDRVADIVLATSDTTETPKPPWRQRKERYLAHLADPATDPGVLLVSAGDKLHNARSILADLRAHGDALWTRFNAKADEQRWYYRRLADTFRRRLPGPLSDELDRTVTALEAELDRSHGHDVPRPRPRRRRAVIVVALCAAAVAVALRRDRHAAPADAPDPVDTPPDGIGS